jgi:uncharacterized protein (TIGR02246 family)
MGAESPQQMHELFAKFYNSQDVEGLLSLYEDDAILLAAPGLPAQGKDAIRGALQMFVGMGGTITFTAEAEPMINGDLALTHAKFKMEADGMDPMEASTAEVVRRGADGKWRYVIDNPVGSGVLDIP